VHHSVALDDVRSTSKVESQSSTAELQSAGRRRRCLVMRLQTAKQPLSGKIGKLHSSYTVCEAIVVYEYGTVASRSANKGRLTQRASGETTSPGEGERPRAVWCMP
jgi:hypothetical protein